MCLSFNADLGNVVGTPTRCQTTTTTTTTTMNVISGVLELVVAPRSSYSPKVVFLLRIWN